MKAEDLQLGDWVSICKNNVIITGIMDSGMATPTFVTYTNPNIFEEYINRIGIERIEPIPLTSEILEKNSFLKVEAIKYPSDSVGISFLYRNTSEGLRIFVQNACAGEPTCTMIKTCKYIHEVQHIIKMCDIEKTFVL